MVISTTFAIRASCYDGNRVLVNSRMTRLLFEAAEDAGIPRASVIGPLGLDEHSLVDPKARVEWSTLVACCNQLSRLVNDDPERLRYIGTRMSRAPAYEPLRRLARGVVSVERLHDLAARWVAPINFPHCVIHLEHQPGRLMTIRGSIPDAYVACKPFMHLFEGSITHLSTLLGLPPAVIRRSVATDRTLDLVVELPPSRTWPGRIKDNLRVIVSAPAALRVLEEQRAELLASVEALRAQREDLRVLLDRLPNLVLVHFGGKVVWANRRFVHALGYERLAEIVGTPLLDHVAPRSRDAVRGRMESPVDAEGSLDLREFVLLSRSGAEIVVEVAPTQGVVFEGVPSRLVVGRDVSDRVQMEQKLIAADRLAAVGLLAAGVAHEVNNPLAYILNNIEIARKELSHLGPEAEVSRNVLGVALEGVDRIRAIVRDLLLLSRGDGERQTGSVDVRAVTESTLSLAAGEIGGTAELVREIEPVPMVRGSDSRVAQVLLNLIGNALEAMRGRPRSGNVLRVSVGVDTDGRVLLEVSDTGRGIGPNDLGRVFEPFFTTKAAGQGTGLGLAIAQQLVVEMGGEIEVVSELGRGTTFRVHLPPIAAQRAANPELLRG